jgi:superfamily II DNA helicase RecQ
MAKVLSQDSNYVLIKYHRPHQREIILAALDGKDVFVQAATSFGKSLCFQLPAVIDRGSMFFWTPPNIPFI